MEAIYIFVVAKFVVILGVVILHDPYLVDVVVVICHTDHTTDQSTMEIHSSVIGEASKVCCGISLVSLPFHSTLRCSASFFAQERAELEAKRKKIREIQKGLVTNFDEYRDLPNDIPQTLVIGTAVTGMLVLAMIHCITIFTARLPDHGTTQFFTGKVEAVDLTSHQYLVAFDRPGIQSC